MKKKFLILCSVSAILLLAVAFMASRIYHLNQLFGDKPKDLVVANVTSTSVEIFWKGTHESIPTLSYKETTSSGLYKDGEIKIWDNQTYGNDIYIVSLNDLDPTSEYTFEINTGENVWEEGTFTTLDLADTPSIPNTVTGEDTPMSFVLASVGDSYYMLDTEYHGTWAFDLKDSESYEVSEYGNYMSTDQLREYSRGIFNLPQVYAQDGANCRSGSDASYSGASKSNIERLATQWVSGCSLGHYATECYSDVVCKANSKGVNPAFALTIWLNESGASNYANLSNVQDFGINGGGIPAADFNQQIDRFLSIVSQGESYMRNNSSCGYDQAISLASASGSSLSPQLIVWGAVFKSGNGCNTSEGVSYMTQISTVYNWVTNGSLSWPLTGGSSVSGCSFSGTNSGYNSCTNTGTSTVDSGSDDSGTTSSSGLACGEYGCAKDSDCAGWNDGNGDVECNERSDGDTSKQYCSLYRCPDGYDIADDGCTCEKTEWDEQELILGSGVNFVSLEFTPYTEDDENITAYSLMEENSSILVIGEYLGDTWASLAVSENGNISGSNFQLLGSRAYLIVTKSDLVLDFSGYGDSSTDLGSYKGWTLVPKDLIGESTAKRIITDYQDLDINQVAVWNTSTSMFENLNMDVAGEFYGNDISLYSFDSLFVKIE